MTPTWTNGLASLYCADARAIPLPDQSVHCVVTSPPYWGQRHYGLSEWLGGNLDCQHQAKQLISGGQQSEKQTSHPSSQGQGNGPCVHCGAEQQVYGIGLEDSLGEWAESLVSVFREVGRVLRDDGTLWLNVGDAYTGSGKGSWAGGRSHGQLQERSKGSLNSPPVRGKRVPRGKGSSRWGMGDVHVDGMPPKNLMGLPWRLAFALQDDGWWLRSEIIWHKPNPMPGSQKDRPTSSHETIFLMSKRQRYFYDHLGFRLPAIAAAHRDRGEVYEDMQTHNEVILRDVWTFSPQARQHAHEAAFPDELPRRCILLGTSARGVCAKCGAPWRRVVEKIFHPQGDVSTERGIKGAPGQKPSAANNRWDGWPRGATTTESLGWEPTCDHRATRIPATVLDPFVGSGTTCAVAQQLGRRSAGIDLSKDYLLNIARPRLEGIALPMELGV